MKKFFLTLAALIVFYTMNAQIITTIAGTGSTSDGGDGGPATAAGINGPLAIALGSSGSIFIGEYGNVIRKINLTGIISTFAGTGLCCYSGDGGPATSATFNNGTYGVAVNGSGNVYITDQGVRVRMVNSSGIINTFAGNGIGGFSGDGGPATSAEIGAPAGVAADNIGNIYIVDQSNNRIRKVNTSGVISTIAGGGTLLGDGGLATAAYLDMPSAVTIDASGNIYIAEKGDARIRKINSSGIINTVAGNGTGGYSGDGGLATAAKLLYPVGVAVDNVGNLYISDNGNNVIRKVNTSGIISTFAGGNTSTIYGALGDGGPAVGAWLSQPQGIAVDNSGNLYIADYGDRRIRKISDTVLPIIGSNHLCVGDTLTLRDSTVGGVWSSSNTSVATIGSISGYITSVATGVTVISYGGIVAMSLTVNPLPISGTIVGASSVCAGASITLSDLATGGIWNSSNTSATVTSGIVSGVFAGIDTISYIVTNSCGTSSATKIISVNPLPAAYSMTGGGSYCASDTGKVIGLGNSISSISYNLYNGISLVGTTSGTGSPISFGTYTAAGTYTATATNTTTSCVNNMIGSETISINPLPIVYTVGGSGTFAGSTNVTLSNSQSGVNYQLFDGTSSLGSPVAGSGLSLSFPVTATGVYFIVASSSLGCIDTMSNTASITITPSTGFSSLAQTGGITISPNPVKQILTINAPNVEKVQIIDVVGKIIIDEHFTTGNVNLDLGGLRPGIYFARVNGMYVEKIVKE